MVINGIGNISTITSDKAINKGLIKNSRIHTNLAQEVIVTTEDKVRLCLNDYLSKISKKNAWIAPFGILITIVITLISTNFKSFLFSADTWIAIFVITGGLNLLWLFFCLKSAFASVEMDTVIDEIKKGSSSSRERGLIYLDKEHGFIRIETSGEAARPLLAHKKTHKKKTKSFEIIKAAYGIDNNNVDLTAKLKDLIKDKKLSIEVNNALAGSDPVPGIKKYLEIEYSINGKKFSKKFDENEYVSLP